jgi:ribonucleoside-diphosphate reductase alpha chain
VQAAAQPFIDSAISKTINVPAAISFAEFEDIYRSAYEQGCKGCTTYRPNDVTGSVLSAAPEFEEPKDAMLRRRRDCRDG